MAPTSDERREVAARLREDASCSESSPRDVVESYLGIEYDGADVLEESYTSESLLHIADLIDPTCHPVPSDGGFFTCSECGERIGAVLPTLGTVLMHHCSHCGARVVSSGGELHGITGTEIGKYRYVSDNEDGKEG